MARKYNRLLKVGDRIKVWWNNDRQAVANVATITKLEKYRGPLEYLWPKGARIAYFAEVRIGMTLENDGYSEVV